MPSSAHRHRLTSKLDEPFAWRICGSGSTRQLRRNGAGSPTLFECQKSISASCADAQDLSFCLNLRYICDMKKTLLETNPYLKDPVQRKRLLRRSLVSSFAIEGIHLKEEKAGIVKEDPPQFNSRSPAKSG